MKVEKFDITFGENVEGISMLDDDSISLKYEIVDGFLIARLNAVLTKQPSLTDVESEKLVIIGKTDMKKIPKNNDLLIPIKKGKVWSLMNAIVSNNDGIIIVTDFNNCKEYAKSYFFIVDADIDGTQSTKHTNLFAVDESNEAFLFYLNEDEEGLIPDFCENKAE